MKIGIIGAMAQEVKVLTESLEEIKSWEKAGATFYSGNMAGNEVIVVQSGIGKVLASLTASLLIQQYQVDLLINTGSAGGIGPNLSVGDVVIANQLAYYDVDATGFGYAFGQLPGGMPLYYETDKKLVEQIAEAAQKEGLSNKKGLIVTGDSFIDDQDKIQEILTHFPEALCCEMEGAAIVQTAQQFNVPAVVIRAMSDTADHEATQSFDEFIDQAGKRSAEMVMTFIHSV
ncbi:5'-methylthioadenosine/S-adenosylhomocysteine nucleosidase [Tetragenococcus osmophilus]|uniref:adenosylhomocysteine nucleosidase n=1 Tax=Tetragenococcus osmophilus TaxID=526944 RepID=A0AA38CVW7_9ENTE|nr:5'-methylthioadenosine/adenosylhomocysteine nucleosidase [Tetragenococcus osmophilus]AYW47996.1 5'-methylthioadenosine/S-adenosylhomocysteine nucleosidase [Tetragenococcus osmophilus]GMA53716.1 5'-methylthioadenosine/S-adenosylhomocysteine nucleosidase [Alicyclobacillus contaminans]GMA72353.1 5'-methylthioadenosine/S-adenosylhomocysteine nucleosidase [Tetragenococcus osmophilus]